MAPLPETRKDHWKLAFQRAWDVIRKDVDRGGGETSGDETANDGSEAKDAIFRLDNEMEAFISAVRQDDLDTQSDKELLDLFCKLANHRNTTPLVKDWVMNLQDDHDRRRGTSRGGSCLRTLLPRLSKPRILPAEHGLPPSVLERLPKNLGWVAGEHLRVMLLYLTYLERDAWRAGNVQVPAVEKRLLSQRILNDIQYVEKEALGIIRKPGDPLYIDANTTAEERLQRLCGRTIAMWVSWYYEGLERDLEPQLRRRWQQRPAEEPRETPQLPKPHLLLGWLRHVWRFTAAIVAESRICQIILEHYPRRFVRSLENASTDGALLLDDFFDPDQESLERHDRLEKCRKRTPPFLPIDIKHAVACPDWTNHPKPWSQRWNWICIKRWRKDKRRGVLILTSATDPERVVVCPANALFQNVDDVCCDQIAVRICEREILPGQTCPPAFASHLKPYEIPLSDLGEVLSLLSKCAQNVMNGWRNPATNVRLDCWGLETSDDRNMLLHNGQAEQWVRLIETRFREANSRYRFRTNALAPLLGDGHFYNVQDREQRQRFLEIKATHLRVSRRDVTHSVTLMNKPMFTWRHQRDFLLSIPHSGGEASALLIPWREIPSDWRRRGYEGEMDAHTSLDDIRQYLLPWPPGVHEASWPSFCTRVAQRLDQEEPPSSTPGFDFLSRLPHAALEATAEKDLNDADDSAPPTYDSQRYIAHRSALALHRVLINSGHGVIADAGVGCETRYFICRRRLPSFTPVEGTSLANISCLSCTALLMPIQFVQIKAASTIRKVSAFEYRLKDGGPGLLICDSWDPRDLNTPHSRYVADSRDFSSIKYSAAFDPSPPKVWEDLEANEVKDDERNIVQQIFRIFQPDNGRSPPVVLAASVFREMRTSSRFT